MSTTVEQLENKRNSLEEIIRKYQKELSCVREELKKEKQRLKDKEVGRSRQIKAIHALWEKYWPDDDNTEAETRLKNYLNPVVWLEYDVKHCLKITKLDPDEVALIREIVKDCGVNFDRCYRDAEIRLDFASALKGVNEGTELSHSLDWSFTPEDILALAELHRKNRFRKKIEDLLTGCNFHYECGMLKEQRYDELVSGLEKKEA